MSAAVLRDPFAEEAHRSSQRERLRAILLTGETYTNVELERLMGGQRFGGRLHELRSGKYGPALDVRKARLNGQASRWAYTCVGLLIVPEQLEAQREAHLKRLRLRIARLQAQELALAASMRGDS